MTALLWSLASLAVGLVFAVMFLSCVTAVIVLIGGLRAHHRAGMARLVDLRAREEREAWQRIVAANRDIDADAP